MEKTQQLQEFIQAAIALAQKGGFYTPPPPKSGSYTHVPQDGQTCRHVPVTLYLKSVDGKNWMWEMCGTDSRGQPFTLKDEGLPEPATLARYTIAQLETTKASV